MLGVIFFSEKRRPHIGEKPFSQIKPVFKRNSGNITKSASFKSFLHLSLKDAQLLFLVTVLIRGILMQIWKFHYMLGFIQEQCPGNSQY